MSDHEAGLLKSPTRTPWNKHPCTSAVRSKAGVVHAAEISCDGCRCIGATVRRAAHGAAKFQAMACPRRTEQRNRAGGPAQ